ncbi:HD-GYP domain-containing protein [Rhizobium sp. BK379]|jgi:putative nucleotidyltransferase with HDIG domain|uniref:HD-GYP domain-containing protein n=1 Tax=Rhizobium sp. BK379 TaxID=2587059 RepID=UPI00036D2BCD|nr:HD-GYP domain-containing protein [Rhizobium sp. BK379]MBB3447267.1 putative nucleotidyltransferase with HDIG domain [Rhizobium sp. BK379]
MLKRIPLNQLRVGMFINDMEFATEIDAARFRPFLVSKGDDVRRLAGSHVRSVVIDITKGIDVVGAPTREVSASFEAQLLNVFSRGEINRARQSIQEVGPHLRHMLQDARVNGYFADEAATSAVERIMLETLDNTGALVAVAKLKEKDETTFLHSLAVSALMIAFGRCLGHGQNEVRVLGLGGLVHDLGKMAIPDDVLNKPGKLTAEEMDLVRTHPQKGYEMVAKAGSAPPEVLDICRFHHERYDGGGYPDRLSGRKIPYVARVAAICDVYEVLTTVRPYKPAFSQAEAINMMMNSPGHFDQKLLSAFVSNMVISGTLH